MKPTGGTPSKPIWLAIGLLLSLLAHGLILLLPGWSDPRQRPVQGLEITLAPPRIEPVSKPLEQEPEPSVDTQVAPPPDAPPPDTPPPEAITDTSEPQPFLETNEPELESSLPLRERVMTAIAREHGRIQPPGERNVLRATALPRLPDSPGWLNDYVGPVTPSIDRWVGNDGSRHTRIVLANGQVVCGRADPPSPAELFNPSMSLNIMRFGLCGRERPTPVDRSDPWLRAPVE